jgi:hypothetical protein
MPNSIANLVVSPSDIARFYIKVDEASANGCRLWNRSVDANGYGQFHLNRRTVKAHLVAWAIERGAFPVDLEPDHTCNVCRCVAPDHIEWVTHQENNRRIALRATLCRAGLHRWDEQVPVIRAAGRECRPCRNDGKRSRYGAHRAQGMSAVEARNS